MSKTTATPNPSITTRAGMASSSVLPSANQTSSFGPMSNTTAATHADGGMSEASHTAIVIIIAFLIVLVIAGIVFFLLKKLGKVPTFCPGSLRKRRSSTSSSRRALDEESMADSSSLHRPNEKLKQTTEEMFTIDDFEMDDHDDDDDGDDDGGDGAREEYYYDEVFGQSEFEDETTKNSVRQLYASSGGAADDVDEMLDFDFETLGIRADGFSRQAAAASSSASASAGKVAV